MSIQREVVTKVIDHLVFEVHTNIEKRYAIMIKINEFIFIFSSPCCIYAKEKIFAVFRIDDDRFFND